MLQDIKRHKLAYSLLSFLAILYLLAVYYLRHTPFYLLLSTVTFGLAYSIWGIIHHLQSKNLTGRVVLEYILVTALGIVIISSLLL